MMDKKIGKQSKQGVLAKMHHTSLRKAHKVAQNNIGEEESAGRKHGGRGRHTTDAVGVRITKRGSRARA